MRRWMMKGRLTMTVRKPMKDNQHEELPALLCPGVQVSHMRGWLQDTLMITHRYADELRLQRRASGDALPGKGGMFVSIVREMQEVQQGLVF
ncbi:unnamed protein product [Nippostrongylus brasiliensis]|uniref:Transposase n=1 Tax=Nippostrongylus brasiliensis TaxID=27835 RepID=A0A0N4YFF1_NIPBR|nr:unnamed protein product [Nippostrongylus brasiliensis]